MIWIKGILIVIAALFGIWFVSFLIKGYCTARKVVSAYPILQFFENRKKQPSYCRLDDVSENIKIVIVALEDKNFFKHHGFDICKIVQAFYVNLKYREKRLGGSTITQQLAKNMYFSFRKTYSRKIAELFVALKLEKALSKEEILELYLNIIFFGRKQENIYDACQYYFGKKPSEVSLNQAITIGSLIPAPTYYNPLNPRGIFTKAKKLSLIRLCKRKLIKEEDIELFQNAAYNDALINDKTLQYERKLKKAYEDLKDGYTKVEN